jgi:hypothetical protein
MGQGDRLQDSQEERRAQGVGREGRVQVEEVFSKTKENGWAGVLI